MGFETLVPTKNLCDNFGRETGYGRILLTNEEIREIAIQGVFVSLQDDFGCLGSCYSRQVHRE